MNFFKKGFTLLELLIVIGILAILMTVVAYVLNPAQMLAQSRDSTRLSDISTLNSAIGLYLSTATTSPLLTAAGTCATLGGYTSSTIFGVAPTSCTSNSSNAIGGTGWVNINFNQVPSGAPIGKLPIDPVGSSTINYYAFKTDGSGATGTYKIDGVLESTKYSPLMTTDGGTNNGVYEVGTGLSL